VAVASFRWIETPLARTIRARLLPTRVRGSAATPEHARAALTTTNGRRLAPRMAPQDHAAGAR